MSRRWLVVLLFGTRLLAAQTTAKIGDLTRREGDIPKRLVGYGLVVGLDGTGDRNYGSYDNETPTVRSIVNVLLHFGVRVPDYDLAPRNAAAVLVTGEVSPYMHAGGRFEVQVSSLSDATSLKGGVLWITPLVSDPNQPAVATAQGPLMVTLDDNGHGYAAYRRSNSGRIPEGGVLEVDSPPIKAGTAPKLVLRNPDLDMAAHIVAAINTAYGPGTATLDDPGSLTLKVPQGRTDSVYAFLAGIDTISVTQTFPARIVINGRDGTVVTGGDVHVGAASISHDGLTLKIGPPSATPAAPPPPPTQVADSTGTLPVLPPTVVAMNTGATVEDVAAGLHIAGATTQEIAAIFDALRAVHALTAEVVVR